jgi:hypothetical protein
MFNMQITKTQKIVGSVILLVVLLTLYIVFDRRAKNAELNITATNQVASTTTTTTTGGGVSVSAQGSGVYTIQQVPLTEGQGVPQPMPDLSAKVVFSGIGASLTPDVKTMVEQKISALQATLLKTPTDFDSWIQLGIYQKMAGDYTATIASWQYAGKLSPTNFISFGDLGDLSAYFLKDTASAEKYYAEAIANGPTEDYLYIQLAQVEHDIELNSAKALATINAGLIKIPNDPGLLQYKAGLSQ